MKAEDAAGSAAPQWFLWTLAAATLLVWGLQLITPPPAPALSDLDALRLELCAAPGAAPPGWEVTGPLCAMQTGIVRLLEADGAPLHLPVFIARTPAERAAGYQFIGPAVIERSAILFLFPSEISGAFHMCNVRAPLDIAWFRADGSLLEAKRMEPGPAAPPALCSQLYGPDSGEGYRFALETAAGTLVDDDGSFRPWRLQIEPWM